MIGEQQDVRFALAQRRHEDREHVEPVEQILPERAATDRRLEILVGGRDHPDVDFQWLGAAKPLEFPLLEDPQQLHLGAEVDVADLVEQQRSAVGQLEAALLALLGAGERALFVAEELRLDQRFGQRSATDLDERLPRPQRVVVDGLRDELLAGARLAADEDGRVGARHLHDLLADLPHRAARSEDVREVVALAQLVAQPVVLVDEALAVRLEQRLHLQRLRQHRSNHAIELHRPVVVAIAAESELDLEHAPALPRLLHWHADVRQVVVISDGLWRRRYGSDPTVIGRTIVINGTKHLVIGIASPSLLVPTGSQLHSLLRFAPRVDIWKPIAPTPSELSNESWDYGVLVRLADGANVEEGRQRLAAILTEMIRTRMPEVKTEVAIQLVPLREVYAGKARLRLLLILAASALLLLTACASVANVFLARVASQGNEFATRIALGAGRGRILSQTLTETILLAVIGGAIGALLATYGANAIAFYGPADVRLLADTHVNAPFLLFSMSVTLATGIACGIVPAWTAYRKGFGAGLQDSGRTTGGGQRAGRSRDVLVGVEMALATVLLASSALLLHSFVNVMGTDRGYEVERVLTADVSLTGQRYAAAERRVAFYRTIVDSVRALPGVLAVGAINPSKCCNIPNLKAAPTMLTEKV